MKTQIRRSSKQSVRIPNVNIFDYRVTFTLGCITGMLIVGLPQLIGVSILLGLIMFVLKLVGADRV